jgi:molybdopterin converting factor subunit 1
MEHSFARFDASKVVGASSSHSVPREQDAPATIVGGASSSPSAPREQDAPATVWDFFNPLTELDIRSSGNLPHWEQGAVWYFVTFRLADALPRAVAEEIRAKRERWINSRDLACLSRDELAEYHRLFSKRYETLLDAGSGSCLLRDPLNAEIVHDALRFFDGQRYVLDEYVVMPNHVHVLVKPLASHGLAEIFHSWKSFTANRINRRLGQTGSFWQHESYDHIVRNESAMHVIRRYIRENPSKVGGASSSPSAKREQDAPATMVGGASCSPSEARTGAGCSRYFMTILYFAQTRRLAGIASESVLLPAPVTSDALWAELLARHPALAPLRSVTRLARNGEFITADTVFVSGDEIALIPPVSGG